MRRVKMGFQDYVGKHKFPPKSRKQNQFLKFIENSLQNS